MDKARKEMLAEASESIIRNLYLSQLSMLNEYGVEFWYARENYRQHWSINSGVDLRI